MVSQSQGEGSPSVEGQDEKAQAREAYVLSYNVLVSSTCSEILKRYQELSSGKLKSYHPKAVMLRRTVENLQMCDFSTLKNVSKLKLVGAAAKTQYFEMQVSDPAALYAAYESWRASFQSYIHLELGKKSKINPYQASEYNQKIINASNGEWKKLILRIQQTFTVPVEQASPAQKTEQVAPPEKKRETQSRAEDAPDSPEKQAYLTALKTYIQTAQHELRACLEQYRSFKGVKKRQRKVAKLKRIVSNFARFRYFMTVRQGAESIVLQSATAEQTTVKLTEEGILKYHEAHLAFHNTYDAFLRKLHGGKWRRIREHGYREEMNFAIAPAIASTFSSTPSEAGDVSETPPIDRYKSNVKGLGLLPEGFEAMDKVTQQKEILKIREHLFEEALDAQQLMSKTEGDETLHAFWLAKNRFLTFVFHMEGFEAAKKAERHFAKICAQAIRDRNLRGKYGWMVGGAMVAAATATGAILTFAGTAASTAGAWAGGKIASFTVGGAGAVLLYRAFYKGLLWAFGHTKAEKEAQELGVDYERYIANTALENSKILRRRNIKILAGTLAGLGAAAIGAAVDSWTGLNVLIAGWLAELYQFSGLKSVIEPILGKVNGLADIVRGTFEQLTDSRPRSADVTSLSGTSPEQVTNTVNPETNLPAGETMPVPEDTPPAPVSSPSEVGPAPSGTETAEVGAPAPEEALADNGMVGLPMQPGIGDGLTQLLSGVSGMENAPDWLKAIGADENVWREWAIANGVYDPETGKSILMTGSDTFRWGADHSLMMHMADGSWQMAITPEGAVQGILKSRTMI